MADKKTAPSKSKDSRGLAERGSARKTKEKVVHVAGKRKRAVARATIRKGKGSLKINNKPIELYMSELARMRIQEPILLADNLVNGLDITVNVHGGGWSSQAEAARLSIAKALVEYTGSAELKKKYLEYDRQLLVADTRYKETKKPLTHSRARAKRQKSYR